MQRTVLRVLVPYGNFSFGLNLGAIPLTVKVPAAAQSSKTIQSRCDSGGVATHTLKDIVLTASKYTQDSKAGTPTHPKPSLHRAALVHHTHGEQHKGPDARSRANPNSMYCSAVFQSVGAKECTGESVASSMWWNVRFVQIPTSYLYYAYVGLTVTHT